MLHRNAQTSGGMRTRTAYEVGGWGGIRTHEGLAPLPVFKTGALNRSATHPGVAVKRLAHSAAERQENRDGEVHCRILRRAGVFNRAFGWVGADRNIRDKEWTRDRLAAAPSEHTPAPMAPTMSGGKR
jgi:hypothetical protein